MFFWFFMQKVLDFKMRKNKEGGLSGREGGLSGVRPSDDLFMCFVKKKKNDKF